MFIVNNRRGVESIEFDGKDTSIMVLPRYSLWDRNKDGKYEVIDTEMERVQKLMKRHNLTKDDLVNI